MTTEEFKDWFAAQWGDRRCPNNPSHLLRSYNHKHYCERETE